MASKVTVGGGEAGREVRTVADVPEGTFFWATIRGDTGLFYKDRVTLETDRRALSCHAIAVASQTWVAHAQPDVVRNYTPWPHVRITKVEG